MQSRLDRTKLIQRPREPQVPGDHNAKRQNERSAGGDHLRALRFVLAEDYHVTSGFRPGNMIGSKNRWSQPKTLAPRQKQRPRSRRSEALQTGGVHPPSRPMVQILAALARLSNGQCPTSEVREQIGPAGRTVRRSAPEDALFRRLTFPIDQRPDPRGQRPL